MFCPNCGNKLPDGAAFCSACGSAVGKAQPITMPVQSVQIGFSNKVNDPSLQATLQKGKKGTLIFALILVLLPIIVAFGIGVSGDDFSVMPIGFIVSAIMLVFNLVSITKKKSAKQWDGIVIDKQSREKHDRDLDDRGRKTYIEYTTILRDDSGKTRKITEGTPGNSAHPYYEYLSIGDRVRFHPQFHNFYEKYDKTHDTYVYCAICGRANDIAEEHCSFCKALLIK